MLGLILLITILIIWYYYESAVPYFGAIIEKFHTIPQGIIPLRMKLLRYMRNVGSDTNTENLYTIEVKESQIAPEDIANYQGRQEICAQSVITQYGIPDIPNLLYGNN